MLWIIIVIIIAIIAALPKLFTEKKTTGPSIGKTKSGPVPVAAMVLSFQTLKEKVIAPGTIMANESVDIKSETSGRLVLLNVREGTRVNKGVLLAKINDADLLAQLSKASASLKLAADRETRQKGLLEKAVITQDDYDISLRDLESAKADVALFKAQIEKTEVRAPFEGRLGLKYVSDGAYLSTGASITTLVSDRPLKIDFSVPEKYAGRVKTGDTVTLVTSSFFGKSLGTVYAIDPMIDENTRTLHVRAVCTNPNSAVVPGAFAEVTLMLGEKSNAILVPTPSLVPDATGQRVFCVKEGKAVAIRVTTGVRDSSMVEITSGLSAGDRVITSGVLMLKTGTEVTIASDKDGGVKKNARLADESQNSPVQNKKNSR